MNITRRQGLFALAGLAGAAAFDVSTARVARADSDTTEFVQVNMWDRGPDVMAAFDFSQRIMLGTPGTAFKDEAPMGFTSTSMSFPMAR